MKPHESSRHGKPEDTVHQTDADEAQAAAGYYGGQSFPAITAIDKETREDVIKTAVYQTDADEAQAAAGYYGTSPIRLI